MSVYPRVLVIDDEPQIHRFLRAALEAAGFEPLQAQTGGEGLREIARAAPAAVVLDLGLPDMDGKEVLRRAREFYHEPIIILSARDRETEKIEALDLVCGEDGSDVGVGTERKHARFRTGADDGEA